MADEDPFSPPGRDWLRPLVILPFLTAGLALFCWLVFVCADFLGVSRHGPGLGRAWTDFALRVSLGILLPPALVGGFDRRRPGLLRLREACRASLVTFLFFGAAFFAAALFASRHGSRLYAGLLPEALRRIGPVAFCLLLWLSHRLIGFMLPQPRQTTPAPAAIRVWFAAPAAVLVLTLPVLALAPLSPLGLPALPPDLYDIRALPQDLFVFASLPYLIRVRGQAVFLPAWLAVCLLGPLSSLLSLGTWPLPWMLFHLFRGMLAAVSVIALLTPSSRRWLVA